MKRIANIWSKVLDKIDPEVTIELDEVIHSKKHGHEVCIMRLVGKNIFPIMSPEEILSNKKAMMGLSREDLITITRLDMKIKTEKDKLRLIEIDRNGTLVLEDSYVQKRYSELLVASDVSILNRLIGKDAYRIGYRVGLKEGITLNQKKKITKKNIFSLLRFVAKTTFIGKK